jgi:hypothetical protein
MKGTQFTIGQILTDETDRDAIHVAVLPVISGENYLGAGDRIGIAYGTKNIVVRKPDGIGIVDPFLQRTIHKDEKCWMFIQPNTVENLRHDWRHPAIDDVKPATDEHELWLRQFADRWNFDYAEMIAQASAAANRYGDNYITAMGIDLHSKDELGADHDLFWEHLEKLTGKFFTDEHRDNFVWSCSC